ncbi:MAG: glycosyltransferase family 87 protein [Candidatus Dormiibacterota bacterium]
MRLHSDRRAAVLLGAAGLSLAMAIYFTRQTGPGVDLWAFYRAAGAMLRGGNPYSVKDFVSPPGLAVLLEPLARLPFHVAYFVFLTGTGLLGGLSAFLFGRQLGWKHPKLLAVGSFLSWFGFSSLLQGQVDALLLAALLGSLLLLIRGRMLAAGLVIGLFWLKPDLMWPAVLFAGIAIWTDRKALTRYLIGLAASSAVFLGLGAGFLGDWVHVLVGFGGWVGRQPDLAGLPALLGAAPSAWGLGSGFHSPLTWALLAATLAGMSWLGYRIAWSPRWRQMPEDRRILWAVGLAMGLWLLVTPYSHPNDDLLILPLVVLVIGKDAISAGERGPATALLLMAVTPIAWLWIPFGLDWIAVAALLVAALPALGQEMALTDCQMGQVSRHSSSTLSLTVAQHRPGPNRSQIP